MKIVSSLHLQNSAGLSYQSLCQNICLLVKSQGAYEALCAHKLLMKNQILLK